jgi:1,4-alpha-glucan branching enzyme
VVSRPKQSSKTPGQPKPAEFDAAIAQALVEGRYANPFAALGPHPVEGGTVIRVVMPGAQRVQAVDSDAKRDLIELQPVPGAPGLFAGTANGPLSSYRLRVSSDGQSWEQDDAYRFGPVLGEIDEYLIGEGSHLQLWHVLGAHVLTHEGSAGTHFAVWAPSAERVSVVGAFNSWDGRRNVMRPRGSTGVWEIFIPGIGEGERYKYEIRAKGGRILPLKADPVGFGMEHPPQTASVVRQLERHDWKDNAWLDRRADAHRTDRPICVYEVHLGSWRRVSSEGGRSLSYLELADQLVPYVADMGFTHIEAMPVSEYPFDGSWGYQPVGLFAPTIRYGMPDEFCAFVEACHDAGLGLILDWVPGHFPADAHGLAKFDGTPLYEHADPREGYHPDWNTLIYNYGRREVANFLIANALYWLRQYHVDGLRVDAVASMLYRDYSRKDGEWIPNIHGGRENLEAISFLRRMNETVYGADSSIMTVAEESTAFPGVSRRTSEGGLGFGYKWNMGWMNDTLDYMQLDPVHRKYHHHKLTFGLHYAFSENFVLPLSHDEVVHGKGSLLTRMPGNRTDKFANLRAYFAFMWGHPGKKLLFMGGEFGQEREWNHDAELDWHLLDEDLHRGVRHLVRDLNRLYRAAPALHRNDCDGAGFRWLEANAAEESVVAWCRFGAAGDPPLVVVCNFTPVERSRWRLGVPEAGKWIEKINTDARDYAGAGRGNLGGVASRAVAANGCGDSIEITLPPLSTLIFELAR